MWQKANSADMERDDFSHQEASPEWIDDYERRMIEVELAHYARWLDFINEEDRRAEAENQ